MLAGESVLGLLPTGGGKSLCYQVPALITEGCVVCVSPLIALMQDQVSSLRSRDIKASLLNSTIPWEEQIDTERDLLKGEIDILYVSPERVLSERFISLLNRSKISLFAIDEAHCICQWGHDFRADYLRLQELKELYPSIPRLALTATADSEAQEEIARSLAIPADNRFVGSFDRPNIFYSIQEKSDARKQLLEFIKRRHFQSAGIVYCSSRKKVEDIAEWLAESGVRAGAYHAGLTADQRDRCQRSFLDGGLDVVVATIAFGMGIDKPDVRFVAHLDMPKSIEAYYQETGRAGRDGKPSEAWMLFGFSDVAWLRDMLLKSEASEDFKNAEWRRLNAILGLAEVDSCRRGVILQYFGQESDAQCGNCDNCISPPETWSGTTHAQMFLSAVLRTRERFGANYIVNVLRGKSDARIEANGHHQIPTFGVGKNIKEEVWKTVARQLVAKGFLSADPERRSGLRLTPLAPSLLRGYVEVNFRKDRTSVKGFEAIDTPSVSKNTSSTTTQDDQTEMTPESFELLGRLKGLRLQIARTKKIPAFYIFSDRTLIDMANKSPQTLRDFSRVIGVGPAKRDQYGNLFIAAVKGEEIEFEDQSKSLQSSNAEPSTAENVRKGGAEVKAEATRNSSEKRAIKKEGPIPRFSTDALVVKIAYLGRGIAESPQCDIAMNQIVTAKASNKLAAYQQCFYTLLLAEITRGSDLTMEHRELARGIDCEVSREMYEKYMAVVESTQKKTHVDRLSGEFVSEGSIELREHVVTENEWGFVNSVVIDNVMAALDNPMLNANELTFVQRVNLQEILGGGFL